jgi:hypothetical protein
MTIRPPVKVKPFDLVSLEKRLKTSPSWSTPDGRSAMMVLGTHMSALAADDTLSNAEIVAEVMSRLIDIEKAM